MGLTRGLYYSLRATKNFQVINQPYKRLKAQFWRDFIQKGIMISIGLGLLGYVFGNNFFPYAILGMILGFFVAFIQSPIFAHFILRIILYSETAIPRKYATFLGKVSSDTGLLEKDGGLWRYRHQLIQNSLADWFEEHYSSLLSKKMQEHKRNEKNFLKKKQKDVGLLMR